MENRISLIGIILEDWGEVEQVNEILHINREYIIGRMGLPQVRGEMCVISIVLDAPNDVISSVSGKLGMLKGVSAKTIYSKQQ